MAPTIATNLVTALASRHACHIPVVEVDVETGLVEFIKYTAVHDAGTLVNPRSLNGHIIGGAAQGIGTALFEEFVYDDEGQLLNASYQDYLIPGAMDVPELVVGHQETPSPYTPYGIKGGGEGGRMMAPAAVSSAIDDALKPLGVRVRELPATPERVLGWIEGAASRPVSRGKYYSLFTPTEGRTNESHGVQPRQRTCARLG